MHWNSLLLCAEVSLPSPPGTCSARFQSLGAAVHAKCFSSAHTHREGLIIIPCTSTRPFLVHYQRSVCASDVHWRAHFGALETRNRTDLLSVSPCRWPGTGRAWSTYLPRLCLPSSTRRRPVNCSSSACS